MTTTLIDVFPPNAFVVQSSNGATYDLLAANGTTGVVTSAYLPSSATNFLTARLQKLIALLPSLSTTALSALVRNLLLLDQLEGTFTVTVANVGAVYTMTLSGLASPSNLQVSIPFSTSSPFTGNPPAGTFSIGAYGLEFGQYGSYAANSRIWGWSMKVGLSSAIATVGMGAPVDTGSITATANDATNRYWNRFDSEQAGGPVTNAGIHSGAIDNFTWDMRPYFRALIRTADVSAEDGIGSQRIWCVLTGAADLDTMMAVNGGSNSIKYVGLRYDTGQGDVNWMVCSGDGSANSVTDSGVAVVAATEYAFVLDFSVVGTLTVTINGTTVTKTTNLPTGNVSNPTGQIYVIGIRSLAGDPSTRRMRWHHHQLSRL